jgi:hypothetical protein
MVIQESRSKFKNINFKIVPYNAAPLDIHSVEKGYDRSNSTLRL